MHADPPGLPQCNPSASIESNSHGPNLSRRSKASCSSRLIRTNPNVGGTLHQAAVGAEPKGPRDPSHQRRRLGSPSSRAEGAQTVSAAVSSGPSEPIDQSPQGLGSPTSRAKRAKTASRQRRRGPVNKQARAHRGEANQTPEPKEHRQLPRQN